MRERPARGGQHPRESLASYTQRTQTVYNASAVYLARPDGTVVVGGRPDRRGERVDLGDSTVQQLRAWSGDVDDRGRRSIAAQVPIIDNERRPDRDRDGRGGVPLAGRPGPQRAARTCRVPRVRAALGVAGSWLLARLIKRRTRGLEPAEIGALADQREAVLHSIREGVVAVAADGRSR